MSAVISINKLTVRRGKTTLWSNLDLQIKAGEFIAILGPNGAGKTTLLRVLLGLQAPTSGGITILGNNAARVKHDVGYVPQQKNFDSNLPLRGRDLVQLGLDGHRYGLSKVTGAATKVNKAIKAVRAEDYANAPLGELSGGEQQRLRIAQALVGEPKVLLCDEPLLSLDINSQHTITALLDTYRNKSQATILFVTHEVNPVLPYVDRILYLANGQWLIDTPEKVLQSETLSKLYGSSVEVVRLKNRVLVVGGDDAAEAGHEAGHHGEHL